MQRWSLVLLCWAQLAQAQPPTCPGFPDTSGHSLLARLRALPPVGIDEERDSCPPATVTSLVHGAGDLCLFNGEVLAAMAAVTALASDATVVEYNYLLPYAPAAHARLLAILDKKYARLPVQQAPAHLRACQGPGNDGFLRRRRVAGRAGQADAGRSGRLVFQHHLREPRPSRAGTAQALPALTACAAYGIFAP